ncbi:hypothetical protein CH330_01515 [candidate division WOR-3 bacterium JGI_Cruoil_03_51_56]|uniref:Uncharacterized protein n=1 Tax=candidate division WOR-3 bacterium JGI_Cruoil_03_51_56 TaxID=1973747 RepID=A0A235BZK6_UNCW3|nr:MAG: hypothetical protein CH330_01515 [candidate division WOR-3 bacterium JGI_Cruoil_03_51_56]
MEDKERRIDPAFIEKIRRKREEQLAKRTDYERAIDELKAHAGYCETKERIYAFLESANVKNKEEILERLVQEKKVSLEPKVCMFPYILHLVATKEEEEKTKHE